jgi:RNA polymerase sigma-70 factor (ECF subfamily)
MEDARLVRALLDGEPGAWDLFVARYAGFVAAVVRRILRGRGIRPGASDVDDIVENTFVSLLERNGRLLERYDPEHKLQTYLGVIGRTQAHRWLRARKQGTDLPDEMWAESLADSQAVTAGHGLARQEALDAIREGLAGLTEREQLVLKLFYYEGADYKVIAERLGISINTIGSALTRARAKLETAIKQRTDLTDSDFRSVAT